MSFAPFDTPMQAMLHTALLRAAKTRRASDAAALLAKAALERSPQTAPGLILDALGLACAHWGWGGAPGLAPWANCSAAELRDVAGELGVAKCPAIALRLAQLAGEALLAAAGEGQSRGQSQRAARAQPASPAEPASPRRLRL